MATISVLLFLGSIASLAGSLFLSKQMVCITGSKLSIKQIRLTLTAVIIVSFFSIAIFAPPIEPTVNTARKLHDGLKTDEKPSVAVGQTGDTVSITPTMTPEQDEVAPSNETEITGEKQTTYLVTRIIDGDTIDVSVDGKAQRIRLIGIDTPETKDPRKSVECFGQEATNKMTELLQNKKVALEADPTQDNIDKYNRLLRYVIREDGLFINKALIEQGYAFEYTYQTPYQYQAAFKTAQKTAETQKLGLWADEACKTATPTTQPTPSPVTPTQPATLPPTSNECIIKGNISTEKIYHVPGCGSYEKTTINTDDGERWFCTEQEAIDAGWRKALNC